MLRKLTQRGQTPMGATIIRRRSRRRMVVAWSAGAVTVMGVFLGLVLKPAGSSQLAAAGPVVGSPPADFTLPDLSGQPISLHRFLGRPLLLQFWAVDCP